MDHSDGLSPGQIEPTEQGQGPLLGMHLFAALVFGGLEPQRDVALGAALGFETQRLE